MPRCACWPKTSRATWESSCPPWHPRPDEVVIVKQYASAFFGTSLAATLTAAGIDTAVIAGVSTSGCVRASATDAMQHGFRPIVVAEACGDRTPAIHTANVADLQAKYADIATIAEATAHFTAGAAGLQRRRCLSAGARPASGSWARGPEGRVKGERAAPRPAATLASGCVIPSSANLLAR